jgi:hypothetical protein
VPIIVSVRQKDRCDRCDIAIHKNTVTQTSVDYFDLYSYLERMLKVQTAMSFETGPGLCSTFTTTQKMEKNIER